MEQDDWRTVGWAGFGIADAKDAGIDLSERSERRAEPVAVDAAMALPALSSGIAATPQRCYAEEPAARVIDLLYACDHAHHAVLIRT